MLWHFFAHYFFSFVTILLFDCSHVHKNLLQKKFIFVIKIDGFFTENGLLSYENPNYHLDPKSIKHNQNLFEEIMSESKQRASNGAIMNNRKSYACLDIGSMGVDLKENFE